MVTVACERGVEPENTSRTLSVRKQESAVGLHGTIPDKLVEKESDEATVIHQKACTRDKSDADAEV